jgi:hypothetical protein
MLAFLLLLLSLARPSSSQDPALPVPPQLLGPNNGGHFMFGTVSWVKLQHQPPIISFTVEAAFRRSYSATNFKGSGDDGLLVVGDTFKPSGLESIMFDFGDGSMLTPMQFTVQAYSKSQDWVQGVSTFRHQYARFSSTTPFEYVGTFKGCCRLSDIKVNGDTAWALSSIMNLRDDMSSPRLTVLPVQTVIKKHRPSTPNPSLYIPASDDLLRAHPMPLPKTFAGMPNIGHAPSIIGTAQPPANLPHLSLNSITGEITLATGAVFASDDEASRARCVPGSMLPACQADFSPATGRAATNMSNLEPGLYNMVAQLRQGNSTAPVEILLNLVAEDPYASPPVRMPHLLAPSTTHLFYPHLSYAKHVAYLGFPMQTIHLSGIVELAGMNVGFTTGRMPAGVRISTVAGGTASFGYQCVNGTYFCREAPGTVSNGTDIPGCTAAEPDTGKACIGPHNSLTACRGGAVCQACWHLGTCPTSMGNISVDWTPTAGHVGTHMLCFDVTAQRPAEYCADTSVHGCRPISSKSQCINIEVLKDPAPVVTSTFARDLDPYAHTDHAYIGRTLRFTVYAHDNNCRDKPAITMGHMPPGASLGPQVCVCVCVMCVREREGGRKGGREGGRRGVRGREREKG